MKKCPRCGTENPDDKKFCKSCMKPLQDNPVAGSDHGKTAEESRLSGSMGNKTYRNPDEQKTAGDKTQSHVSGFAHSDVSEDVDTPHEGIHRLSGSMGSIKRGTAGDAPQKSTPKKDTGSVHAELRNSGLRGSVGGKKCERDGADEKIDNEKESVRFNGESNNRFCIKCGKLLEKDELFCTRCGEPVINDLPSQTDGDIPPRGRGRRFLLGIAIAMLLVLIAYFGTVLLLDHESSSALPTVQNGDREYGEFLYDYRDFTFTPNEDNIAYEEDSCTIYFNNLLVVYTFDNLSSDEAQNLAESVNGSIVGKINGTVNMLQIMVHESSLIELNSMADILMTDSRVLFASYDYPVEFAETSADSNPWSNNDEPPDDDRGNEYKPDGHDWWAEAIGAYSAWEYKDYCTPIKVGIIDSGFWDQHDDLRGKISFLPNYSINSESNHGTHVAGIIAAKNNNIGIRGIADEANLVCVDWSPTDNTSYLSSGEYIKIIKQLVENDVKVINNSWGYHFQSEKGYTGGVPSFIFNLFRDTYDTYVKQVETYSKRTAQTCIVLIIELLLNDKEDFLVVQAAGNGYDNSGPGVDARYSCHFCAIDEDIFNSCLRETTRQNLFLHEGISYTDIKDRVIIVGAVDNTTDRNGNYEMSYFSNYGESVDICAPGRNVYSTVNNQTGWFVKQNHYEYRNISGTSMAAPIVAGSAAQVWSIDPTLSAADVKGSLIKNALYQAYDPETNSSYPMLNLGCAVETLGKRGASHETVKEPSSERDIVLVLDTSGSMNGTPISETKKAASSFINTILQEDANIGIVTYDSSAHIASDFSTNATTLTEVVEDIYTGGNTNIDDGLSTAYSMLQNTNAKKKIIVLMSDGVPNEGRVGDSLVAYADELKNEGILIYTLGFFEDLGYEKASAQALLEGIASDGCHYEVTSAEDLVFFFGDMADQINGQKYIYIRIACPVDVYVSFDGEVLNSSERNQNLRTNFGTLSFEENEDGSPDPAKILRLKESIGYEVKIFGTGYGYMDYTIGFMDGNGEYTDMRMFRNIQITSQTVIDTVAAASKETILNVDADGDGKYDVKYRAAAYGYGKEVKGSILPYVGIAVVVVVILYFALAYLTNHKKSFNRERGG